MEHVLELYQLYGDALDLHDLLHLFEPLSGRPDHLDEDDLVHLDELLSEQRVLLLALVQKLLLSQNNAALLYLLGMSVLNKLNLDLRQTLRHEVYLLLAREYLLQVLQKKPVLTELLLLNLVKLLLNVLQNVQQNALTLLLLSLS